MKKLLSVVLAILMLVAVIPLANAAGETGWSVYAEDAGEDAVTFLAVAPAKYTRFGDTPQLEVILEADGVTTRTTVPAETDTVEFRRNGKTDDCLVLKTTVPLPGDEVEEYAYWIAVLPGSVLDANGAANARAAFMKEEDYLYAGGFAEIEAYSRLLLHDYSVIDETIAVGDTVRVEYWYGLYPVDVYLNGQKVAHFAGGEAQKYTYQVQTTEPLEFVVRSGDRVLESRSFGVITSKEMYDRNLDEGLIHPEDIPKPGDIDLTGVPIGNPFFPFAMVMMFFNQIGSFFHRLFSFFRIVK